MPPESREALFFSSAFPAITLTEAAGRGSPARSPFKRDSKGGGHVSTEARVGVLPAGSQGALLGAEPTSTNSQYLELRLLHRLNRSSVASITDGKARLLAADDSAGKCAVTRQEKRDACFEQCKTS